MHCVLNHAIFDQDAAMRYDVFDIKRICIDYLHAMLSLIVPSSKHYHFTRPRSNKHTALHGDPCNIQINDAFSVVHFVNHQRRPR